MVRNPHHVPRGQAALPRAVHIEYVFAPKRAHRYEARCLLPEPHLCVWVTVANKVQRQAGTYGAQLKKCSAKLDKSVSRWFF